MAKSAKASGRWLKGVVITSAAAALLAVLFSTGQSWVMRNIDYAFSRPHNGFFGQLVQGIMAKHNMPSFFDALARLDPQPHEILLEICIGQGLGLEEALRYPIAKVIGVDISPDMVEASRQRVAAEIEKGRAEVVLGSVDNLASIPDGSIDKVIHMNCCYFWPNVPQALAELKRVLKPGGKMLSATKFEHTKTKHDDFFLNKDEGAYISATQDAGFSHVKAQPIRLGSGCTGIHGKSGCPVPHGSGYTAIFSEKP